MSRTQSYYLSRTLFYILLAIIFVYIVFPFYWAVRSSVSPDGELFVTPVHYWPFAPTKSQFTLRRRCFNLTSPNAPHAAGQSGPDDAEKGMRRCSLCQKNRQEWRNT